MYQSTRTLWNLAFPVQNKTVPDLSQDSFSHIKTMIAALKTDPNVPIFCILWTTLEAKSQYYAVSRNWVLLWTSVKAHCNSITSIKFWYLWKISEKKETLIIPSMSSCWLQLNLAYFSSNFLTNRKIHFLKRGKKWANIIRIILTTNLFRFSQLKWQTTKPRKRQHFGIKKEIPKILIKL